MNNPGGPPARFLACAAAALLCEACSNSRGGPDASIHVYDLSTGLKEFSLPGHNRPTTALAVSADGQHVLTASMTRELRLWSLPERRQTSVTDPHLDLAVNGPPPYLGSVHSLSFVEDTRLALVGHEYAGFALWHLESNTVVRSFKAPFREASSIGISADRRTVTATDTLSPVAASWNLETGEVGAVRREQWLGDTVYVALGHQTQPPQVWWHSDTCEPVPREVVISAGVQRRHHQAQVSPDGLHMVTYQGSTENVPGIHSYRVWDIESGRLLCQRSGITLPISYARRSYSRCESFAFSAGSQLLAVGHRDGKVEVREMGQGTLVGEWSGPPESCEVVAFIPDGTRVLTWGGTVMRLWDVESGALIRSFDVPVLSGMALTPDGQWLIVGGYGEFRGL